jgi:ABC-type transport system involved in multi-copper enzyme maturation permease subunit
MITQAVKRLYSVYHWFSRNPIIEKELRSRMRGLRTFILITLFVGLISISAGAVLSLLSYTTGQAGSLAIWQRSGLFVFSTVFLIELALVCFIAPALTSSAISSEIERQTFDLLRTTLLTSTRLVLGKMSSALAFLMLLMLASIPIYAMAYTLGGVTFPEILIAWALLLWSAVFYSTLGIWLSALLRRTLLATVIVYVFIALFLFGIPILILGTLLLFEPLGFNFSSEPPIAVLYLIYLSGWVILSSNPLTAAIFSEVGWLNNQSLILLELPLSGNSFFYYLSPWIPFLLLTSLGTFFLSRSTIRIVHRQDQ